MRRSSYQSTVRLGWWTFTGQYATDNTPASPSRSTLRPGYQVSNHLHHVLFFNEYEKDVRRKLGNEYFNR